MSLRNINISIKQTISNNNNNENNIDYKTSMIIKLVTREKLNLK